MLAPADRSAALLFAAAIALLLHLGMLLGAAHPGQLDAPSPSDAVGVSTAVLDGAPGAAAAQPAAEHPGAGAHLMLQLCLATVAAAVVIGLPGPRRLVQPPRAQPAAGDPPSPRMPAEHPPPPGRSRIESGLVLRV